MIRQRSRFLAIGLTALVGAASFFTAGFDDAAGPSLRDVYSQPPENWPAADWDRLVVAADRVEIGLVGEEVHPPENPYTREKAELGRMLFWDPRLSGSGNVACVSCHHPDLGWSDGKTVSQGHQLRALERNAPTVLGAGHLKKLMWDGRADSLEAQAILPITNENEMHGDLAAVEQRLNSIEGYRKKFKEVFGEETITIDHVTAALACFQRTLEPGRSRFDAFLKGNRNALTDQQLLGLHLFRTKARCINCHSGPMFTDGQFHNLGLTFFGRKFEDLGRYNHTKNPDDVGKFKTPTLRNVSRTGPYMHNGLFDLDGVLNMYNAGMPTERTKDDLANHPLLPTKSPLLQELKLSRDEKAALIAFLESLEEPRTQVRRPDLPE